MVPLRTGLALTKMYDKMRTVGCELPDETGVEPESWVDRETMRGATLRVSTDIEQIMHIDPRQVQEEGPTMGDNIDPRKPLAKSLLVNRNPYKLANGAMLSEGD